MKTKGITDNTREQLERVTEDILDYMRCTHASNVHCVHERLLSRFMDLIRDATLEMQKYETVVRFNK